MVATTSIKKEKENKRMYQSMMMNELEQLMKKGPVNVLDVREPEEYEEGHIPGAILAPISEFLNHIHKVDKSQHYYVVCYSGARSQVVAEYLGKQGFKVTNVMGGMSMYRGQIKQGL
jgi:rhodanese-related sulfurtransferase